MIKIKKLLPELALFPHLVNSLLAAGANRRVRVLELEGPSVGVGCERVEPRGGRARLPRLRHAPRSVLGGDSLDRIARVWHAAKADELERFGRADLVFVNPARACELTHAAVLRPGDDGGSDVQHAAAE